MCVMSKSFDSQENAGAVQVQKLGSRPKLHELTRNHFEPLYGSPLSDADVVEIIESLEAYGRALRDIKNSLTVPDSAAVTSSTILQNDQVGTATSLGTLHGTGQLK